MWGRLKNIFRPRTFVYTLGGIASGAALILSPYSPFGTVFAGAIGLIAGYMLYDITNKHEMKEEIERTKKSIGRFMQALNADPNDQALFQRAQAIINRERPIVSSSTVAILNKIGNSTGAALVTAGLILQGIASAPTNANCNNSSDTDLENLGTILASSGLGVGLFTHWLTAPLLRQQLQKIEKVLDNVRGIEEIRAMKHLVNATIDKIVNDANAAGINVTAIANQHKM